MLRVVGAVGLAVTVALPLGACGKDIKIRAYDPPAEAGAADWRTWVIGDPAKLAVPPPPSAQSAEGKDDAREVERIADKRTLAQEREARFWALEPTIRPWLATTLNRWTHRRRHDPVAAARSYALVSVAMYDATVATWHWKYAHRRKPPSGDALLPRGGAPSYPSEHAAIAAAAARVLSYAFPETGPAAFDRQAREAGRSRVVAGTNFPSDVEAGLALGRRVGDAVVNRAKADGSSRRWGGVRPRGRGFWEPPPGSGAAAAQPPPGSTAAAQPPPRSPAAPIQPLAGSWRPWLLKSGRQLRPPAPPKFDSAQVITEARRVVDAGKGLTGRQKRAAERWEGGTGTFQLPGTWNQVALSRVDRRNLSIPRAARAFALLNVAMADAGVASWDSKSASWFPRPENAVRDLGVDRSFRPFLTTPASPAYASEHSAFSTAAAQVLGHLFPDTADRFNAQATEAGKAAVDAGIQYPFSDEAGRRIGERAGELVVERAQGDGAER